MRKTFGFWPFVVIAVVALAVYWKTAYPVINWWDSSSYSLASSTLAVVGPPGSLVLTLLGWPVAAIAAPESTAHLLNMFAGLLAAITVLLTYSVANHILETLGYRRSRSTQIGAALGALTLAFTTTFWEYAVQFTPYILTALFTTLILLTLVCWWRDAEQPGAWRYFALAGLLIGIDFSVHRTNSLLLPGILAWVAIRHPRTLLNWRTWGAGWASFLAALSLQLLLIPIARHTHSPLNWNDTSTLPALWDFISLARLGGGFLVSFLPRNAPFWSVQVADVVRTLTDNFFHWHGVTGLLGVLSAVAGVVGLAACWRRNRRFGFALTSLLLLQAVATVLYFNIPEHFFRSLDRHYLPICVTFGIAVACGLAVIFQSAAHAIRNSVSLRERALAVALVLVACSIPLVQLADNWRVRDASDRYFASDYAHNVLDNLPRNAIYFTGGDNDTFPILYVQSGEGIRPDVQLVNLSLLNDATYVEQLVHADSAFPLFATRHPRSVKRADWTDSTLTIPVVGSPATLGLSEGYPVPATFVAHPTPAYIKQMLLGDLALIDILRTNAWRRPLTFALTAVNSRGWLERYTRLDGAYYRVLPVADTAILADLLRVNIFALNFRGYANSSVVVDDVSRNIGGTYYAPLLALLSADRALSRQLCVRDRLRFTTLVPAPRVGLSADLLASLQSSC
ncbi:MAG: DUF2723 domain-containing protein [Gemmatimonadota bacterium]|nr:DUF2723 domain-containing protein [Gemmatimonadota bacterium]